MSEWPKYDSHKVVQAAKIVNFETRESGSRVCAIVDPGNGALEVFIPSVAEMLDETEVGGWALFFPDGFRSTAHAKAFENGFLLLVPEPKVLKWERATTLRVEIEAAISRTEAEHGSNTPDFVLAEFLTSCLRAFDSAVRARETWYGRDAGIGPDGTPTEGRAPDDDAPIEFAD